MGSNTLKVYVALSALTVTAFCFLIWKKKERLYVKVGRIAKLYYYPVKSLKGYEVTEGYCTRFGLKVNGLLDRSFMVITAENVLLSQREAPRLALLSAHVKENMLLISSPGFDKLEVEIKNSVSPEEKLVDCQVITDSVKGVDCGDEAALWFQTFLDMSGVRLVRFFESFPLRKYTRNNPIFNNMKKKHPIGYQNLGAFHIVCQASIEDLNSKIQEKEISVFNFRPNILVEDSHAFEDDSWRYLKFDSGAEMEKLCLTTRCSTTTNDPKTGILSRKEPLTTLRKYRIPNDPSVLKITGARPCLGTTWGVLRCGKIKVGDDIYAVVGEQPSMKEKRKLCENNVSLL